MFSKSKLLKKVVKFQGRGKVYSKLEASDFDAFELKDELPLHAKAQRQETEEKEEKIPIYKLLNGASCKDLLTLLIGIIAAIFHGSAAPILAIAFGSMTDAFIQMNETQNSVLNVMSEFTSYYLILAGWVFITTTIQAYCWEMVCENQIYRMRNRYFNKIMTLGVQWHDSQQTGKLCSQLTDDLERVREGIGHKCSFIIQYLANAILGFVVGFSASWKLTLLFTFLTPILVFATGTAGAIMANATPREQSKYGDAGASAQQALSSIRTVAAFSGERKELRKYKKSLEMALKLGQKKNNAITVAFATVGMLTYLSYSIGIWYALRLLLENEITPGQIFTVFFSALSGAFAIGNMLPFITTFGVARGAAVRPYKIIEFPVQEDEDMIHDYIEPKLMNGVIEFKIEEFSYPTRPETPVIQNLQLKIEKGQKVAFVGSSGAGKSTILNLLLRFYEPKFGSIFIDGINLKYIHPVVLRESIIGVVSQESALFSNTCFENIALGGIQGKVTFHDVVEAAKLANAHDFITALPNGYYTKVGDSGSQLSTGQRQRIIIARAIVGNPRILVLDEATSALDVNSEKQVQIALNNVMKDRTTLIIAHRLNTVRDADKIYFLQNGLIIESGTHDELMSNKAHYYEHAMSQQLNEQNTSESDEITSEFNEEEIFLQDTLENFGNETPKIDVEETIQPPGLLGSILFLKPEWELLSIGMLGSIIVGAVPVIFAYLYGMLFHVFSLPKAQMEKEGIAISIMFGVLAIISGIGMWMRNYTGKTGEQLAFRLRVESFRSILRQPISWFENKNNSPGKLLTRLSTDAGIVKGATSHRLALILTGSVTIKLSMGLSMVAGWQLASVLGAVYPFIIFAAYVENKISKRGSSTDRQLKENAGKMATESISNVRTVLELGKEHHFMSHYNQFLLQILKQARKEARSYCFLVGISEAVIYATYALAFTVGAHFVNRQLLTVNAVYKVFFAVAFSAPTVGQLMALVPDYYAAREAFKQILTIIYSVSPIDPFSYFGSKPQVRGSLRFENVHFSYPQRASVKALSGLNLTIKKGQTLGIVGDSGSGKSTIISLIERYYDVDYGRIMIDDMDIRGWNLRHLRHSIGYVSQDTYLFDSTIWDNIAYGHIGQQSQLTQEQVENAAKIANAHQFIVKLPEGYQTLCGEKGVLLSGGQKQRIAIARAILRDPKILLLDEATSSLDPISEKVVQSALDNAKKGRTCIMVAHRLCTIQNADNIIVMRKGVLAEQGTHSELLEKKGIYYSFVQTQKENNSEG